VGCSLRTHNGSTVADPTVQHNWVDGVESASCGRIIPRPSVILPALRISRELRKLLRGKLDRGRQVLAKRAVVHPPEDVALLIEDRPHRAERIEAVILDGFRLRECWRRHRRNQHHRAQRDRDAPATTDSPHCALA